MNQHISANIITKPASCIPSNDGSATINTVVGGNLLLCIIGEQATRLIILIINLNAGAFYSNNYR